MKKLIGYKFLFSSIICFFINFSILYGETTIEARSRINWITRDFTSNLSLDVVKAHVQLPSGKKAASMQITNKMPQLIQPSLLCLFADSNRMISDLVVEDELKFADIYNFITSGYKTSDVLSADLKNINTTNAINLNNLSALLVKQKIPARPENPIDQIPSRAYTGIIIDARGALPVHGEYVKSSTYPCLFPTIWDEGMSILYEKNMVQNETTKKSGLVQYHYSDNTSLYEDRIGADPLYIKANQVYGRNRTDPVIHRRDALKVLTIPENVELIKQGKVVILLDKENLIYDIASPLKDNTYYVNYNAVKQYIYENKVQDITVSESLNGIVFSVDLKFIPDSPELLSSEKKRIEAIADSLKFLLRDNSYTILVEGHTADVGKPNGQLNLSIERTRTVMNALISEGLNDKLFTYKGYGGTKPIANNDTEEGRAQNRRVDITARPSATYIQRDW